MKGIIRCVVQPTVHPVSELTFLHLPFWRSRHSLSVTPAAASKLLVAPRARGASLQTPLQVDGTPDRPPAPLEPDCPRAANPASPNFQFLRNCVAFDLRVCDNRQLEADFPLRRARGSTETNSARKL
jgi:hypothetical protein